MGLRIERKSDKRVVHACTHNLADIPNGVTVCAADLVAGGILQEGTALGKDEAGLFHAVKTAKIIEAATATAKAYKVAKGHHFKVGDVVMLKVGGAAYAITAIDNTTDATHDTITVGTTLGEAVEVGGALVQAATAGAAAGAFKYKPKAMTGDGYNVGALNNHFVVAVTIGQFKESVIPAISDDIKDALPGIVLI